MSDTHPASPLPPLPLHELLAAVVESSDDAIISKDMNGIVTSWNRAAERVYGYTAAEIVGKPIHLLVPSDRPDEEPAILEQIRRGERIDHYETVRRRKDGRLIDVSVTISPIRNAQGEVVGASKVARDITDQRRAAVQEALLSALVQSSDDAIVSKDLNGIVTSWNPGAERIFGYSAAEMVGQSITRLFPPDRMDEEPQILARLQRGERVDHFETIRVHKNGQLLNISVSISPVRDADGRVVGASKIARDITAQKQAEAERDRLLAAERQARADADAARQTAEERASELQLTNEELQSQREELEQVSEELQLVNQDLHRQQQELAQHAQALQEQQERTAFLAEVGLVLGASLNFEATLQGLAQLAVPRLADWCAVDAVDGEGWLRRVAVAHADPLKGALVEQLHRKYPARREDRHGAPNVLRTGEPELYLEVTDTHLVALAHDAEHLDLLRQLGIRSGMALPVTARGQLLGVLTLATAESDRRYREEDLHFARELAHRAGLAADNARLFSELQEADRQKDRFLAMLAHELRNPLAAITNSTHVLTRLDLRPPAPQMVEVITRQSAHLARMVDDLLDVSRITRGTVDLQKELVDLGPVVEAAAETVRPMMEARRHLLVLDLPPEPVRLVADATRLEQVFTNLLVNAAKYTEPGGRIEVTVKRDAGGSTASVSVRDNGGGIPPELLPRIFDLFTQGDQSLARTSGGIGIGLTLVRNLVELHDGRVTARSEGPGKGSEFEVCLPALREAQQRRSDPRAGAAAASRPLRVLVVDDNVDSAQTLAALVQLWGHDVEMATDGPQALRTAAAFHPDLVFCDLGLPGMDGYEVARALREAPGAPCLVAVTGYAGPDISRRCDAAGFECQLVKPVAPEDLQGVIADVEATVRSGEGAPPSA